MRDLQAEGAGPTAKILITGFGPFPGVAYNASSDLAHAVALGLNGDARGMGLEPIAHAQTLPTAWDAAVREISAAIRQFEPVCVLAFGVSKIATGFTIEAVARNVARAKDVHGTEPASDRLDRSGPRHRATRVPVRKLVRQLRAHDIPAKRSLNAGAYLCNAVLYQVLAARSVAQSTQAPGRVLFVHIPASLLDPTIAGRPPRLQWEQALEGGKLIARFLLMQTAGQPTGLVD